MCTYYVSVQSANFVVFVLASIVINTIILKDMTYY